MDDRLRDLERRFRETGTREAEAAWLAQRVRAGTLSRERLALARHCGHGAARLALGEPFAPLTSNESDSTALHEWSRVLFDGWRDVYLRAIVAANHAIRSRRVARRDELVASRVQRELDSRQPANLTTDAAALQVRQVLERDDAEHSSFLRLIERWIIDPTDEVFEALRRGADNLTNGILLEHLVVLAAPHDARAAAYLESLGPEVYPDFRRMRLVEAIEKLRHGAWFADEPHPARRLHAAVCGELIPFALGLGDPVLDRVTAARQEVETT